MPNYDFRCDTCTHEWETFMHISERMRVAFLECPRCACPGHQVFRGCNIVGDELGKTVYIDPDTKETVQSHGRVFDEGMGAWYETKSERRRLMKEKGLKEYGGSDPHGLTDKSYQQFYRRTQEAQRGFSTR